MGKIQDCILPRQAERSKLARIRCHLHVSNIANWVIQPLLRYVFSDSDQPSSNPRIKAEVMIWIQANRKQLALTYKGDFSDGYNTYALYSWVMSDGRLYYSFIMKEEPSSQAHHTVDTKRLLNELGLDPNWYILGVELGNEVWKGSGNTEIVDFSVNLNGHAL